LFRPFCFYYILLRMESNITAVILAAGMGKRFGSGNDKPKSMLKVHGKTILGNTINLLHRHSITNIVVVVGDKRDYIIDEYGDNVLFVTNPKYRTTNTAKSLLKALEKLNLNSDVIWINGDVMMESAVVDRIVSCGENAVCVNTSKCGPEEVKYTTTIDGEGNYIKHLSKHVKKPEGEAVGVNRINARHISKLISFLEKCKKQDYFEAAIEKISLSALTDSRFIALDVSDCNIIEIDFHEDLVAAEKMFRDCEN